MPESKRITLVDDSVEFLALLAEQLRQAQYTVTPIPLHQGTFSVVKDSQPDVIICDLGLANVTAGWALVDMLFLDPSTRPIPIIVCAVLSEDIETASVAFAGKGILWLEKPFKLETLLTLLAQIQHNPNVLQTHTHVQDATFPALPSSDEV
jgi:CheY-like chemotaxis protein